VQTLETYLQNVLATELLLRLLHDLQELLESDAAIARDIGFVDDLIDVSLMTDFKRKKKGRGGGSSF